MPSHAIVLDYSYVGAPVEEDDWSSWIIQKQIAKNNETIESLTSILFN